MKILEPQLVGGVGEINFGTQYRQGNRVYDSDGVAMALMAQPVGNAGGNSYLYKVDEPFIAAMRGRNSDNPKSRESGLPTQQMLEVKADGTSNALTTVQKDNLVVEPQCRVRKLTPKECWRLMGFTDEDFEKARKALNDTFYKGKDKSSSQLYKQAGNSIVTTVLMAVFKMMRAAS